MSIDNPGSTSGIASERNANPELSALQNGQTGFIAFTDDGFVGFMPFNPESPVGSFSYSFRYRTPSKLKTLLVWMKSYLSRPNRIRIYRQT